MLANTPAVVVDSEGICSDVTGRLVAESDEV